MNADIEINPEEEKKFQKGNKNFYIEYIDYETRKKRFRMMKAVSSEYEAVYNFGKQQFIDNANNYGVITVHTIH